VSIRIVGIIQARMGSARLPGKVLRPLAGRSVLGWVVRAARESALRRVDALAAGHDRTHVTSYAYTHPAAFTVMGLDFLPAAQRLRVTLDTAADWALIQEVVRAFGDNPIPYRTLIDWLADHPEVCALNAAVRHKALTEA
jgi:spore coat polysaccharide biosynthesis protein SpsF